jgi:hypothetical protein
MHEQNNTAARAATTRFRIFIRGSFGLVESVIHKMPFQFVRRRQARFVQGSALAAPVLTSPPGDSIHHRWKICGVR